MVLRGAVVALVAEKAARLLLSPGTEESRLVPLADAAARILYRAVITTVLLVVVATVIAAMVFPAFIRYKVIAATARRP